MEDSTEEYYSTLKEEHSDRQVVLRSGLQHFDHCIMEAIQISIVNDRVTGNKRGRENLKVGTPKRLRSTVFTCSTPCSSSGRLQNHPQSPLIEVAHPSCSGSGNKFDNEWDDSLLDLSSGEGDSPLYLTVDEIDSLLEDDRCYAAEALCWDSEGESEQTVIQLGSENCEIEKEHPSTPGPPYTVEVESEKENNYAAMAPCSSSSMTCSAELSEFTGTSNPSNSAMADLSPCYSALVKVTVGGEPKKPVCSPTGPETEVALLCPSASAWPAEHLNPPEMVLDLLEFDCEGSELSFDGDIDDLLALSPGEITSEEDDDIPLITSAVKHEMGCGKLGSETLDLPMESLQPYSSLTAANSNSEPSGSVTFPSDSPAPESLGEHMCADTNSQEREVHDIKPNNPTIIKTEPQTASETEENQIRQTTPSTAVDKQAGQKSSTQKVFTPVDLKTPLVTVAPVKPKVKKPTPLIPNPVFRPLVNTYLLEENKERYLGHVMMHLEGPSTSGDPNHELALLLNQISSDNPNWQHPSNFTRRNHPRFERRPTKCSLGEWVLQNGASRQRFQGLPSTFQRSPIPEFLPPRPF